MKITVDRAVLARAVQRAALCKAGADTDMLYLIAEGQHLHVRGSASDVAFSERIDAQVSSEGQCAVPGALFRDYVTQLPTGPVVLLSNPHSPLVLTAASGPEARINTVNRPDPGLPASFSGGLTISGAALKEILDSTAVAAARDHSTPILNGVHLQFKGKSVVGTASDAYSLAQCAKVAAGDSTLDHVLPTRAVSILRGLLEDGSTVIMQGDRVGGSKISISTETWTFVAVTVEGQYPVGQIQALLAKPPVADAILDRASTSQTLKRLIVLATQSTRRVVLKPVPGQGLVEFDAASDELGGAVESLHGQVSGTALQVAVNGERLLGVLGKIATPNIRIRLTGESSHLNIESVKDQEVQGEMLRFCLMPLRW